MELEDVKSITEEVKPSEKKPRGRPAKGLRKVAKSARKGTPKKRKYKHKPNTVALRNIKKTQNEVGILFPKATMERYIREILDDQPGDDSPKRLEAGALDVLYEAVQDYAIQYFQAAGDCTVAEKRQTLKLQDMRLAKKISDRVNGNL